MLTLDETGRLVGGFAWVELRLFEVAGGWAPLVDDPEAAAHLAAASRRHAAHAEVWLGHRPVVADRDADDLVAPPTAGADAALTALATAVDSPGPSPADAARPEPSAAADPAPTGSPPGADVGRLAGLYRVVVPRLVASYATHLEAVSPIADPALRRSLRAVLAETVEDGATGERILQRLVASPDDLAAASAGQSRVEALLVGGGGLG
jgi:hypothetical protein